MLLNVTPDHLDRHGTMENYAAIKARLVAKADLAVIGIDDDISRAIADEAIKAGKPTIRVSVTTTAVEDEAIVLDGTRLLRLVSGRATPVADLSGIASLRGKHNGQNAAAAVAALGPLGLDLERVAKGLRSFPGLPHRLEEVGRKGKVLFVNNSKATNADAAEKALLSFDRVFWIIGGRAKEGGIEPLRPLFGKVVKAYLIGEASELFARTIEGNPFLMRAVARSKVRFRRRRATQKRAGSRILSSTAFASLRVFRSIPRFRKTWRSLS